MDENNKDKLINADKKDSDELMEDTIVFTREPDTIIQSTKRADSSRDTKRQSPRPNPARPQNIPIELQNTAKLQGGAVIRPLKPTRSPNARSSQPNGAQSSGASGNIQPNGSQSSGASGNMQPNGARLNGGVSGNMQSGNTRSGSSASGGMQSNRANQTARGRGGLRRAQCLAVNRKMRSLKTLSEIFRIIPAKRYSRAQILRAMRQSTRRSPVSTILICRSRARIRMRIVQMVRSRVGGRDR